MPLTPTEALTLARETAELLLEVRRQLVDLEEALGPVVEQARARVLAVRDVDSDGGRRVTRREARQLVGDLLDLALRAMALVQDDDDLLKLARRCVRLAKHIMRDVGD